MKKSNPIKIFLKHSVLNFEILKNLSDAKKLKKIRSILKVTQKEFAKTLNIGREAIAQVEAGYNNISPGMEDRINEHFFYDPKFNEFVSNITDNYQTISENKLTDQICIDFLKNTGKYNIYKVTETEI